MHVIILCTIHISVFQLRNKAVPHSFVIRHRFNVVKLTILGTFPKDVFQVETSQRYFLKWQLPTSKINIPSGNFPSLPGLHHLAPIRASALDPLDHPSLSAGTFRKLHIQEVAIWEIVAWEVALGKMPFGKVPNTPAIYQGRIIWKRTYSPFNQILN